MTTSTLIALTPLVLGLLGLATLLFNASLKRYKSAVILTSFLLIAIGAGLLFFTQESMRESAANGDLPATSSTETIDPFVSPVSPVSPIPTAETLAETAIKEAQVELEGCLVFNSNRDQSINIFSLRIDSGEIQKLTDSSGFDLDPAWSPDGTQIVFASNRDPEHGFQIYVMNADGSQQRQVGPSRLGDNVKPNWSPDGNQIVFQSNGDANGNPLDDNYDIYVIDTDGTNLKQVVVNAADDTEPVWSPDGSRVAFLSERSGQDEVYLVDLESLQITQLTSLDQLKGDLAWSTSGQQLLFISDGEIYAVDVETQAVNVVVSLPDSNEATPVSIPDNRLIFSSSRNGPWQLFALDLTDSETLTLAQLTTGSEVDRSPDWFPCEP